MSRRWTRERVEEMYALYNEGQTLEELGALKGVTRQRIAQLFKKYDLLTRSTAETAAMRGGDIPDERIIELYKEHGSIDAVLEHIDVSRTVVANVVAEIPHRESYQRRRQDVVYSTQDYLDAVHKAAQVKGEPLTSPAYMDAAKELDLPSFGALLNHFATLATPGQSAWERALKMAGVSGNPTMGPRSNSITSEECIEAVTDFISYHYSEGWRPTYSQYCRWATIHKRTSGPTVRRKVGWSAAVERAFTRLEEISA